MSWESEIEELRRREALTEEMGGGLGQDHRNGRAHLYSNVEKLGYRGLAWRALKPGEVSFTYRP